MATLSIVYIHGVTFGKEIEAEPFGFCIHGRDDTTIAHTFNIHRLIDFKWS
jgi:hypothetical protein